MFGFGKKPKSEKQLLKVVFPPQVELLKAPKKKPSKEDITSFYFG